MLFYRRTKDWMNFYTFPKIEEKEVSVLVPKLLHFIYVGKPIRENYIDNIRNCTRSDDDNDRNCNFSPQDKHCKLHVALISTRKMQMNFIMMVPLIFKDICN